MFEPIIRLLLRLNKDKFIMAIARLEFGVSAFCSKQAQIARNQGRIGLAEHLEEHGKEEEKHGMMLSSLINGQNKIVNNAKKGCFLLLELDDGSIRKERVGLSFPGATKQQEWDSTKYPGHKVKALFESFDGMSVRYYSLRLFFGGRKASDFDWDNKLSYMYVLEEQTKRFYQDLYKVVGDTPLGRIAAAIASEEQDHAAYLRQSMIEYYITPIPDFFIHRWRSRLPVAIPGLILDAWRIFR